MSDAKSKVKEIQDTIVKENKIDSETIWNNAVIYYEEDTTVCAMGISCKEWLDKIKSSGKYTTDLSYTATFFLTELNKIYNEVTGGAKTEKDF